ncbi:MAG: RdgB/HAM1 family non-canonical purine NTP pyrophosphatase [Candidatus Thalassarchaeaceae archaeon]|jgi:XTP/dITP diphosphohydrolase|nr:RdgB/HAM1 family non-canonical purine NTP pyrophosphatase [Candidatus Thalassarchaeaceae archaeon]MDP7043204.1 RdgB/HAM1 family non-canonical purine NTP pyrophosphatase [Candidatus Thalassarchaeaceae archaeon]
MTRLLFLTGNAGKLVEATQFFAPLGYQVEQFLIDGEVPTVIEPQADDLQYVALSKIEQAAAYLDASGQKAAVLVEDAGLFIDELNGFPGVYSARILKQLGLSGILKVMSGVNERGAEFRACAALWDGEQVIFGEGICRGTITKETRGEQGFGYDPIFSPEEEDTARTFGEMSSTEKGRHSHREKALNSLINQLG